MKKKVIIFVCFIPLIMIVFIQGVLKSNLAAISYDYFLKSSQVSHTNIIKHIAGNDSCILHFSSTSEKEINQFISHTNQIYVLLKYCYEIYVFVPAIGDVKQDNDISDIKIIRYIYPNPLEFLLLLPLYLENDKNVLFDINSTYSFDKISKSIENYFAFNKTICKTNEMNIYLLSTTHLRYVWTYLGSKHFKSNIIEIMKDPNTFKYYYEKNPLKESITYYTSFDTNHTSIYPNNEIGIIERIRHRNNIHEQMNHYKNYENLTTIIFGQNNQFIDYRSTIKEYMNLFNIYLFWCTNFNSIYYLMRLLHLLLNTEFTLITDDDFVLAAPTIPISKYVISKYNSIISCQGFQSYKKEYISLYNYSINLRYALTLYGGQIAKTETFSYQFRMRLPYKYWGDDVGNGQIAASYGLKQIIVKGKGIGIIHYYSHQKTRESYVNRNYYKIGPTILCPFIHYCSKYRNNVTMNKICFFSLPFTSI